MAKSRGRKRHVEHDDHEEHVNHEAWVIPYADILTLLMALFLVMYAIGQTDQSKAEAVAASFRKELGMGGGSDDAVDLGGSSAISPLSGGGSVLDGAGPAPVRSDLVTTTTVAQSTTVGPPEIHVVAGIDPTGAPTATFEVIPADDSVTGDPLTEVEEVVRSRVAGTGLAGALGFRREARGLVVTIVTDQVLFDEGDATIQPDGLGILDVVADALVDLPNDVIVEGHTDSRPISTGRYPSNWELSTARAISVLRHLLDRGFDPARVAAAGYADTRPVDTGTTPEAMARNRRVEIVVLATTSTSSTSTSSTSSGH